jgi:Bacterial regulatory proteins, luxR family
MLSGETLLLPADVEGAGSMNAQSTSSTWTRSNLEIGARLFLSPRTVEWHLRKVFGKLGIDPRNGLHAALPPQARERARL